MRTSITVQALDGLKPKARPYEVRDSKLPGFLVRVQPSGAVSFVQQIARGKRVTLGRYPGVTLARAKKLAIAAMNAAEEGASTAEIKAKVRPDKDDPQTLRDFLDDTYANWLEKNRK